MKPERLADLADRLCLRSAGGDAPRQVGNVGGVVPRRFLLLQVPRGRSSLSLPAMVTVPGLSGCRYTMAPLGANQRPAVLLHQENRVTDLRHGSGHPSQLQTRRIRRARPCVSASNSRRTSSSEMSADQPYAAATAASRASCASASHWRPDVNGNRKPHTSGEDVSGGADILPVMPVGRFGLDAGSGATGVLAKTRREAAEPAVTLRLPHAVRPTLSSASADAPASGSCCPVRWRSCGAGRVRPAATVSDAIS